MKKRTNMSLIAVIVISGLLWGFYIIQEEFAKYGMYRLISYRVHEMSSVLFAFCPLVTIGCAVYLFIRLIKRNSDTTEKILLIAFIMCFAVQVTYIKDRSEINSRYVACTVEEINEQDGTIIISELNEKENTITLDCPAFFRELLVEKAHLYGVTFEHRGNNPDEGEVTMIKLVDLWYGLLDYN